MSTLKFSKLEAAGNDFVVIDARNPKSRIKDLSKFAINICQRKYSVGADGVILVEKSKTADFKMRIFNPDGSEPNMCGNGARCIALYAFKHKIAAKKMCFETLAGTIEADVDAKLGVVKLKMSDPKNLCFDLKINILGKGIDCHFVNTGVPHVVHFVEDIDKIDVKSIGREIRFCDVFKPDGVNVNFIKQKSAKAIFVRTYERGVEDETLACGTGSTASAIVFSVLNKIKPPIDVYTKGTAVLKLYFNADFKNRTVKDVYLEGAVNEVFTGEIVL